MLHSLSEEGRGQMAQCYAIKEGLGLDGHLMGVNDPENEGQDLNIANCNWVRLENVSPHHVLDRG